MFFILEGLANGFIDLFHLITSPSLWFNFSDKKWVASLIYYGGSKEFLFILIDLILVFLTLGLWRRKILWGVVRGIEALNSTIGRIVAWAALIMIIQQVIIVLQGSIFRSAEIGIPPYLDFFSRTISWYADELKLYNAMIVTLCAGYTFIQGGHVRVDLVYSAISWSKQKWVDAIASLVFMLPFMGVLWHFSWYFLWGSLVIPRPNSTQTLENLIQKSGFMRWKIETTGFSGTNGFDAYFLFKVLLVSFAGLMFLQGIAFFYRNILELIEGEDIHGTDHVGVDEGHSQTQAA